MKMEKVIIPAKTIMGISVRTCNTNEIDFASPDAKIFECVQRFFHQQLFAHIPHRKNPGHTYCGYTEYESDASGWYTYFIGEEVTAVDHIPVGLELFTIPAQAYAKFTTEPGNLPEVLRNAWFAIWNMSEAELGGTRTFKADFEVYDERAATADHTGIVIDIYIGIK